MGRAYLLPRVVGLGRASELLLLGDKVPAARAAEIGLAAEVLAGDQLPARAGELAARLAGGPAMAYAATKVLLTRELDMDLSGALEMDSMTQALLMTSHDHREFFKAWSEGRKPAWAGR
jgi:enoyl-CoA hydratase/carnithine racemase